MNKKLIVTFPLFVALAMLLSLIAVSAQDDMPDADIPSDEGGVAVINGEVNYTVGYLPDFGEPAIVVNLTDLSNYVDTRGLDPDYVVPESGQLLGRLTSDPLVSPFTYSINLPIVPTGELRDVDNNGETDLGIAVFQVQVFVNMLGNVYWDQNGEYGTGFNSTFIPPEFDLRNEIQGGTLLVWSPDGQQGFPVGFGDDGLLFTEDDPIVRLPQGYTVVNLDGEDGFTFDRSFEANIDLIEAEQSLQPADYSEMSYTEAFDALIAQMRVEYSFTEYKGIDWDALYEEFAPRFAEAEADSDAVAYQFALRDFTWAIPDGHVGAGLPLTNEAFATETDGSIGIAIRELDDGRVIVNYVVDGSPAAEAGIELGTEILSLNGTSITDAISAAQPWSAPFSTSFSERLQQMRYAVRFELGVDIDVTFIDGDGEEQTATLTTVQERESWSFSSFTNGQAPAGSLPIEFEILDSGYGYIRVNRFSGDPLMLLRLWEWSIDTLNAQGIEGLIIDLRWNSGGYNIYNQMVSMLFDETVIVGNSADYYADVGEFVIDPLGEETIEPSPDGRYYGGDVVAIVSPFCASACEFFGYELSLAGRSDVVGFYPSAGLGGNITPVFMPDGVYFQFTMGRSLNADGDIRFEGVGVEPTIVVPVTEETLFYDGDILLDTAVDFLNGATTAEVESGGEIAIGDSVEGSFEVGERVQYEFTASEDVTVNFIVTNDDGTEFTQRVYVVGNDDPAINVDQNELEGIDIPADLPLILEIGSVGDEEAASFTFSITEFVPPEVSVEDGGEIAIGDSVDGELVAGLRIQYTLTAEEDAVIDILVGDADGALDTYLRVYVDGAEEATYENDDISAGIINSILQGIEVTAGQTVVIEVAGFNDTAEGAYTLSVTASE